MKTKYIIQAAGEQTRWNNYLGVDKHYAILDGEPLIERTVRQLNEHDIDKSDIIVVSHKYTLKNATNYRPDPTIKHQYADAAKFLDSHKIWNRKGRTVIIYGDVYFTDEAIKTIIEYQPTDWRNFCRPWKSQHTGTPWGECFAISFYPKQQIRALNELYRIANLHTTGKISRCGGWEWTRAMAGKPDSQIRHPHQHNLKEYYIIDDLTDDIDYPQDYERLKKAIAKHNQ
jgi:hypothetical protein